VLAFLAVFVAAGARDLGWRRTLGFGGWVWAVAWLAEASSTRTGVPFGLYHYTGATRGQELFLADVPLFDCLSFPFLAYASFCLARAVLAPRAGGAAAPVGPPLPVSRPALAITAGVLMMLLDVVIDPLAVRGDRWFLGRVFYYPEGGLYFGVPLSNFVGWAVVGALGVGGYLVGAGASRGRRPAPGVALYYGVLAFNVVMTAWIGEWTLTAVGVVLHLVLLAVLVALRFRAQGEPRLEAKGLQRA
jgi:putative membrane protein